MENGKIRVFTVEMSISPSNWTLGDYAGRRRSNNGIQIYGGFYYEEANCIVSISCNAFGRCTVR